MSTAVIGRDEELGSIEAFLAEVAQGPTGLVLSGEPGIGKTILWDAGVREAREVFGRVLICRGVEAEASLSFAGLSELLTPVLEEAASTLAPPRRRALEVALLLAEPGDLAPDSHAIGLAVHDVLHLLAEGGPVLIALDDGQWVDPASTGVLQIALRRLQEEPLGVLATLRVGTEGSSFHLDRCFAPGRVGNLSVGPLSLGVVHTLLEERLGLDLTRPELARVQEATAGNPFFALELGRELVRTGTRPRAGQALRVPESLRELLGGRLGRLPAETVDVLLQAAALARPTVEVVASAHGDRERVLEALEAAVREGVVELDESRIRFAHPLLASICYEQAPVWKRRAVHRALASAVTDLEERARHLALAADGPDAVAASYLESAAGEAAARGATAAAAELSELAAELTPDDPPLARRRRLQAANSYRLAGDGERAAALLEQLLIEVPPGVERSDVLFSLAMTMQVPTLIELFDEALAEAAGDDARAARILANRSAYSLYAADIRTALADGRAALEKAEQSREPVLVAAVIGRLSTIEGYAAEITPGLLERGVEIEERLALPLEYYESPRYILARLQMRLGEIDHARALLEKLEAEAVARGDEGTRMMVLWTLSVVEWLAGRWPRALELAADAWELALQTRHQHGLLWMARAKALVEADLGLVEEARATAEEGVAFSKGISEYHTLMGIATLGHLELALGNIKAAGDHLRDLPARLLAGGMNDPTQPVWADAVEALVALGELERAAGYLESYELHSRRLGSPIALEGALRCRALLTASRGDLAGALDTFEQARGVRADPPWPFERARTLLCLGVVRRQAQQKKASRDALEQALGMFEALGARLWAEKARAELNRISGRKASSDELTETERRVAELAAQGRTNREIAAELYMGVSTAEAHLSRVYRKLGIRSRAALASKLAIEGDGANPVDDALQA